MFKLKKSRKKYKKIKTKNTIHNPLISIITVVKNDEKKILKTIKSVFNQSYKNFEYIVIDGASKDKTLDILKKHQKKIDILISKKDKNLWSAMNKGISISSGSIIGIINSGDTYYRNTLKYVKKYFTSKEKLDYLFGPVRKDRILFRFEPEKIFYRFNIYPSHSTGFFITKKTQKKIGVYDTKLYYGSDHDLFYRIIKNKELKGKIAKKNEVFGKFDLSGFSSKIPFYKTYYYENKVRFKNGQNLIYLFFLYWAKILNKLYRIIESKFI